jgi:hypothetical protein
MRNALAVSYSRGLKLGRFETIFGFRPRLPSTVSKRFETPAAYWHAGTGYFPISEENLASLRRYIRLVYSTGFSVIVSVRQAFPHTKPHRVSSIGYNTSR